jgi:hypothetical protein
VPCREEGCEVRDDIEACVATWVPKTAKKVRKHRGMQQSVEDVGELLGDERALAVEPAAACDGDAVAKGCGVLAVTERQLVFKSLRAHAKLSLREIQQFRIIEPQGGLAARLSAGGTVELRSGAAPNYFEIQSSGAVQRLWPALERQVDVARTAASETRSEVRERGDVSVADELRKLAQLRSEDILSDEEFESQKRRLLEN